MSRRSNGLQAASYAVLADVDPRIADVMLELLRDAGVAAYAVPTPGDRGAYGDVRLPLTPTDRLWVDAGETALARRLLDAHLPHMRRELELPTPSAAGAAGSAEDVAWAQIVAGYDVPSDPVPSWPAREDLPRDPGPPIIDEQRPGGRALPGPGPDPSPDSAKADGDARPDGIRRPGAPLPEQSPEPGDDDHYVPPPPPPLPDTDPVTRAAWVALVGGPTVLLLVAVLGLDVEPWVALLGLGGFVGGFITLVARMKDPPADDDGHDDGAVV